jgi:poly(hydroxyalkanoate) granule-associated protein
MTAQSKKPDRKSSTESLQDELSKRGRDVWLAGLGALATVEEEGSKLYNRLVERGKDFEEERRKELEEAEKEVREKRDEALAQLEEAGEETQSRLLDTVNAALERFGVPTRSEVDRLSEKVETLSKQVDELSTALSKRTAKSNGEK